MTTETTDTTKKELVPLTKPEVPALLSGITDDFRFGQVVAGVAIDFTADEGKSTLMIPDITGVKFGKSPVYITKPIKISGAKFKTFLTNKKVTLPSQVDNLLSSLTIALNAFYYTNEQKKLDPVDPTKFADPEEKIKDGVMLMSFEITSSKGLISALTEDDSFKDIFDVTGASLRVLRCQKEDLPILQAYVQELTS